MQTDESRRAQKVQNLTLPQTKNLGVNAGYRSFKWPRTAKDIAVCFTYRILRCGHLPFECGALEFRPACPYAVGGRRDV
jgi:hypothetical protein